MTKFEVIGVRFQNNAKTKKEAEKQFAYSCNCCCMRGMHIECDRCAIEVAHHRVVIELQCLRKF